MGTFNFLAYTAKTTKDAYDSMKEAAKEFLGISTDGITYPPAKYIDILPDNLR
jgi:hypothetical protein